MLVTSSRIHKIEAHNKDNVEPEGGDKEPEDEPIAMPSKKEDNEEQEAEATVQTYGSDKEEEEEEEEEEE
ncbi:hypothetical protein chiPu_0002947 [Chiloscyllium punctatum]|uniref:Uncharacterized protein n=1 Tax=Chiloscyllium punctatum TaxID=137246 RepID=A0A401S2B1_CHIPU|nr:hypothetical protein [Chiloscyllium punctatum]